MIDDVWTAEVRKGPGVEAASICEDYNLGIDCPVEAVMKSGSVVDVTAANA